MNKEYTKCYECNSTDLLYEVEGNSLIIECEHCGTTITLEEATRPEE